MRQTFKTRLKQLWFPAAFRLTEPEFTSDQLDLLEELIQLIHPNLARIEMATKDEKVQMANFLVELGTGIWRIRRKIEGMKRMPKEIKEALYSLESTWASMSAGGVEIVDHIGTIPLKSEARIVEVRDIPDLSREQVVDVVKPTILLRGEVIQMGEVVMGRPVTSAASKANIEQDVRAESEVLPVSEPEAVAVEESKPEFETVADEVSVSEPETVAGEVPASEPETVISEEPEPQFEPPVHAEPSAPTVSESDGAPESDDRQEGKELA